MRSFDGVVEIAGTDRLRAGVGASDVADAAMAGRSAAAAALAELGGQQAALILVFASVRYDLAALLRGVREVTGDTALAGASSTGHFHNGVMTAPGQGVAVLALSAGPYRFGIGSVTGLRHDPFNAGRTMARAARDAAGAEPSPYAALLVLADGLAGRHQEMLNGAYKVTGAAIPVVGGAAGDDRLLSETYVMAGDRVLTDGVVGVWINSPWPLTVATGHGWEPVGLPLLVTKVDAMVVHELAGQPAVELFRDCYQVHHPHATAPTDCRCACCRGSAQEQTGSGGSRRHGYHPGATHALGLIQPDGSMLIRGAYIDDDGLLRTFSPLPVYSAVQVVSCQPDDLLKVGDRIVGQVLAGREAEVMLVFSCVAQLDILGERGAEEARLLQAAAGRIPTFGFYTYGEFARTCNVAGYHNGTVAALAL